MKKLFLWLAALLPCLLLTACAARVDQTAAVRVFLPLAADAADGAVSFIPPEGFEPLSASGELYRSPDYPDDISCLAVAVDDRDPYFDRYTAALLEQAFSEALGRTAEAQDVTVESLKYGTLSDVPCYQVRLSFASGTTRFRQWVVCLNADRLYTFTYTQTDETDWDALFAASIDSISCE